MTMNAVTQAEADGVSMLVEQLPVSNGAASNTVNPSSSVAAKSPSLDNAQLELDAARAQTLARNEIEAEDKYEKSVKTLQAQVAVRLSLSLQVTKLRKELQAFPKAIENSPDDKTLAEKFNTTQTELELVESKHEVAIAKIRRLTLSNQQVLDDLEKASDKAIRMESKAAVEQIKARLKNAGDSLSGREKAVALFRVDLKSAEARRMEIKATEVALKVQSQKNQELLELKKDQVSKLERMLDVPTMEARLREAKIAESLIAGLMPAAQAEENKAKLAGTDARVQKASAARQRRHAAEELTSAIATFDAKNVVSEFELTSTKKKLADVTQEQESLQKKLKISGIQTKKSVDLVEREQRAAAIQEPKKKEFTETQLRVKTEKEKRNAVEKSVKESFTAIEQAKAEATEAAFGTEEADAKVALATSEKKDSANAVELLKNYRKAIATANKTISEKQMAWKDETNTLKQVDQKLRNDTAKIDALRPLVAVVVDVPKATVSAEKAQKKEGTLKAETEAATVQVKSLEASLAKLSANHIALETKLKGMKQGVLKNATSTHHKLTQIEIVSKSKLDEETMRTAAVEKLAKGDILAKDKINEYQGKLKIAKDELLKQELDSATIDVQELQTTATKFNLKRLKTEKVLESASQGLMIAQYAAQLADELRNETLMAVNRRAELAQQKRSSEVKTKKDKALDAQMDADQDAASIDANKLALSKFTAVKEKHEAYMSAHVGAAAAVTAKVVALKGTKDRLMGQQTRANKKIRDFEDNLIRVKMSLSKSMVKVAQIKNEITKSQEAAKRAAKRLIESQVNQEKTTLAVVKARRDRDTLRTDLSNKEFLASQTRTIFASSAKQVLNAQSNSPACKATRQNMLGVVVLGTTYSGSTEAQKDASCCAKCSDNSECEFWVRDLTINACFLKKSFTKETESDTLRGAMKTSSAGDLKFQSQFVKAEQKHNSVSKQLLEAETSVERVKSDLLKSNAILTQAKTNMKTANAEEQSQNVANEEAQSKTAADVALHSTVLKAETKTLSTLSSEEEIITKRLATAKARSSKLEADIVTTSKELSQAQKNDEAKKSELNIITKVSSSSIIEENMNEVKTKVSTLRTTQDLVEKRRESSQKKLQSVVTVTVSTQKELDSLAAKMKVVNRNKKDMATALTARLELKASNREFEGLVRAHEKEVKLVKDLKAAAVAATMKQLNSKSLIEQMRKATEEAKIRNELALKSYARAISVPVVEGNAKMLTAAVQELQEAKLKITSLTNDLTNAKTVLDAANTKIKETRQRLKEDKVKAEQMRDTVTKAQEQQNVCRDELATTTDSAAAMMKLEAAEAQLDIVRTNLKPLLSAFTDSKARLDLSIKAAEPVQLEVENLKKKISMHEEDMKSAATSIALIKQNQNEAPQILMTEKGEKQTIATLLAKITAEEELTQANMEQSMEADEAYSDGQTAFGLVAQRLKLVTAQRNEDIKNVETEMAAKVDQKQTDETEYKTSVSMEHNTLQEGRLKMRVADLSVLAADLARKLVENTKKMRELEDTRAKADAEAR